MSDKWQIEIFLWYIITQYFPTSMLGSDFPVPVLKQLIDQHGIDYNILYWNIDELLTAGNS